MAWITIYLWWKGPDSGNAWQIVPSQAYRDLWQTTYDVKAGKSKITDYVVKVLVGLSSMPESNCKRYPSGVYKPIGILQKHGESDRMHFGLVSGSSCQGHLGRRAEEKYRLHRRRDQFQYRSVHCRQWDHQHHQ